MNVRPRTLLSTVTGPECLDGSATLSVDMNGVRSVRLAHYAISGWRQHHPTALGATCRIAKRDAFTEWRVALLLTLFEFRSRAPLFFDARHRAHQRAPHLILPQLIPIEAAKLYCVTALAKTAAASFA